MGIGAALCLFLMLSGYATAFPNNWMASIEGRGRCASRFSNGCCKGKSTACIIRARGVPACYCDENCHARRDCCDDIAAIGCNAPPTECANAGLNPGMCRGKYFYSCRAPEGCYCDRFCRLSQFCDCCHDVPNGCRRKNLLSIIQERPHYEDRPEINDATKEAQRRLLYYLINDQNRQTAQFSENDMEAELLGEVLAELSKEDQYRHN